MRTTSVKLPVIVHERLIKAVIADGYGMRGKSRWVENAIHEFLTLSDYPAMVDIADELADLSKIASFRLSDETVRVLDDAVVTVRKIYPSLEGVRSNIIRASLMQKLLKSAS